MTLVNKGTPPLPGTPSESPVRQAGLSAYLGGVFAVVGMELRQRLRSRGWYIMLGIWFGLIWLVAALTWISWKAQTNRTDFDYVDPAMLAHGPGSLIFEVVLAFVLLFGLLVGPAFSANAISGDRAGGTLAIMQVTLLRPGQILWGKFLASWVAALAFLVVSVPFLIFGIGQPPALFPCGDIFGCCRTDVWHPHCLWPGLHAQQWNRDGKSVLLQGHLPPKP